MLSLQHCCLRSLFLLLLLFPSLPIFPLHRCHFLILKVSVPSLELWLLFLPFPPSASTQLPAAEPDRHSGPQISKKSLRKRLMGTYQAPRFSGLFLSILVEPNFYLSVFDFHRLHFFAFHSSSESTEWVILSDGIYSSIFLFCFCLLMLWIASLFPLFCQCLALYKKRNNVAFYPLGHACWYSDWT